MMSNIFNQFDPSSMMLNPFLIITTTMLMMKSKKMKPLMETNLKMTILKEFSKENTKNMMSNKKKMSNIMLTNILITISMINLISLSPHSWNNTSHLSFNINLISMMWMPIMMFSMMNMKSNFMKHLMPQNTPMLISPFIFMIEIISYLIRPITLTMRLTANMIAGHTLMMLNSNMILNIKNKMTNPFLMSMLILTLMESIIAILQAYIIMTLISMFKSEI